MKIFPLVACKRHIRDSDHVVDLDRQPDTDLYVVAASEESKSAGVVRDLGVVIEAGAECKPWCKGDNVLVDGDAGVQPRDCK